MENEPMQPKEEFPKPNEFSINVSENQEQMAEQASKYVLECIKKANLEGQEKIKIGLPYGSDTEVFLPKLTSLIQEQGIDISRVVFIETEDAFPVSHDHPKSFSRQMQDLLIKPLGLNPDQYYLIPTDAESVEEASNDFQKQINEGVDIMIAGLNDTGAVYGLRAGNEYKIGSIEVSHVSGDDVPEGIKPAWTELINKRFPDLPDDKKPTDFISAGYLAAIKAKTFIVIGSTSRKRNAINLIKNSVGTKANIHIDGQTQETNLPRDINQSVSSAEIIGTRHNSNNPEFGNYPKTSVIFTDKEAYSNEQ